MVRKSTPWSREGTAAHTLAERALAGKPLPGAVQVENEKVLVTDEMLEHVETYTQFVRKLGPGTKLYETRVDLGYIWSHDPPEPLFGTADFIHFDHDTLHMQIVDLKYGKGVVVDPTDNPQLLYYATGALGMFPQAVTVSMHIIQPRVPDPIKSWSLPAIDVRFWVEDELKPAVQRVVDNDPTLKSGTWCRFCPAQKGCPEYSKSASEKAKAAFDEFSLD